nr:replication-associated protein [Cyclovirus sp.]WNA17364.1 replication-associated protein [Cyclovirus sp.]WNA17366.1 replication-associated protein [Cyclovirus sp.]
MNSTVRRFCFTLHDYTDEDVEKCEGFINTYCKYGIFGKERCPDTGCPHLQGFASLAKPQRFLAIKGKINKRMHIEKAMGSDSENQVYCSKSGEYFEKGSPSQGAGQRTDLQSLLETISGGERNIKRIAELHPACYIRYYRGIRSWLNLTHPIEARNFKTEVSYYWGPPGTGKSRRAHDEAERIQPESVYYKPRGEWWDGYMQQTSVIIDDFYGWIKYDELLKICDRYPHKVPIKGGYEEFTSKHIFITSNVDVPDLYKFVGYNTAALDRRITNKEYIT